MKAETCGVDIFATNLGDRLKSLEIFMVNLRLKGGGNEILFG